MTNTIACSLVLPLPTTPWGTAPLVLCGDLASYQANSSHSYESNSFRMSASVALAMASCLSLDNKLLTPLATALSDCPYSRSA